tara:strand:- start:702 stop:998 length:297 start_codon:yes stop_codon:yes gene_type:complete
MRVSGRGGELRYKYRTAAYLGAWAITSRGKSRFHITAGVESYVYPWCERSNLALHLHIATNRWVWESIEDWRKASNDMAVDLEVSSLPTVIIREGANG